MSKFSILAPIPEKHFYSGYEMLKTKDFVLFASNDWDLFSKADTGCYVYIYLSHAGANTEPLVSYRGIYQGIIDNPSKMKKMAEYRPETTKDEKDWGFYWKISDIIKFSEPKKLKDFQLQSGKYFSGIVPRGPLAVLD